MSLSLGWDPLGQGLFIPIMGPHFPNFLTWIENEKILFSLGFLTDLILKSVSYRFRLFCLNKSFTHFVFFSLRSSFSGICTYTYTYIYKQYSILAILVEIVAYLMCLLPFLHTSHKNWCFPFFLGENILNSEMWPEITGKDLQKNS